MTETGTDSARVKPDDNWGKAILHVGAPTTIFGGIVVFLLVYGYRDGWGSSQWGPVAAWFSGLLTFGAVTLALWQAFEARRNNREQQASHALELAGVEERHRQQLDQATHTLNVQVKRQQRADQIIAVEDSCKAIHAFYYAAVEREKMRHLRGGPEAVEKTQQLKRAMDSAVQQIQLSVLRIESTGLRDMVSEAVRRANNVKAGMQLAYAVDDLHKSGAWARVDEQIADLPRTIAEIIASAITTFDRDEVGT